MSGSTERATPAHAHTGALSAMPFGQVLFELLELEDTGTLLLYGEDDALYSAVRIESGRPVAALAEDAGEHNLATLLLPLFGWSGGRFEFVAGQDLVGEHAVLHGKLDPIPLITAGARGAMRHDWIERSMSRVERSLVHKTHRIEESRYGFTAEEKLVLAALDAGRLELEEIRDQAGVREAVLRRVLYVLLLTRGISLVPRQRSVSGTITRSQPAPPRAEAESAPEPAASGPEEWNAQVVDGDWLPATKQPAAPSRRAPTNRTPAPSRAPTPNRSSTPSATAAPTPGRTPAPSRTPSRPPTPTPTPSRSSTPSQRAAAAGTSQRPGATPSRRPGAYSARPLTTSLPPDADPRARREHAEAQWSKAETLARRGEFEAALELARAAVKLGQPRPEHDAMLGWLILQHAGGAQNVHSYVFRCLDRAFKRDPLCEQVLYYKGLVLNLLGDAEQAQAHFQRVLMLKPMHADAAREVRIYEMRKHHARSESSFLRRLLTGRPKAE